MGGQRCQRADELNSVECVPRKWHIGNSMEIQSSDREWIAQKIRRVREEPSFPGMLDFVRALDQCVVDSASIVGIRSENLPIVRDIALQGAFQICFVDITPQVAVDRFCSFVGQTTSVFVAGRYPAGSFGPIQWGPVDLKVENIPKFHECYAMYNLAVSTVVGEQIATSEGQQILRRLMASLSISFDDLGRMFSVSGETVQRWENGTNPIPNERNAEITLAKEPLNKLLEMFRPSKLPEVIRRTAQMFNGERALEWILQGKITEVSDRYEVALRYPS